MSEHVACRKLKANTAESVKWQSDKEMTRAPSACVWNGHGKRVSFSVLVIRNNWSEGTYLTSRGRSFRIFICDLTTIHSSRVSLLCCIVLMWFYYTSGHHVRIQYTSRSPTKFSLPVNLTTYAILSLFSLHVEPVPHLLSPYLYHLYLPHYKSPTALLDGLASPYLWNQLPSFSSFRQSYFVHSPPGSPHPAHITSSQSPPSFSQSITPSVFHSRLNKKAVL